MRYKDNIILALSAFLISVSAIAKEPCSLTNAERKELRKEARKIVFGPYKDCKDSISEAYYWKAVAKCISEGKGKDIGGGCGHMVSYGELWSIFN